MYQGAGNAGCNSVQAQLEQKQKLRGQPPFLSGTLNLLALQALHIHISSLLTTPKISTHPSPLSPFPGNVVSKSCVCGGT